MDVAGILRGFNPAAIGAREEGDSQREALAVAAPSQATAIAGPQSEAFRNVLSRYDVTNISPREFSELARELKESGAISEQDYQELGAIRLALDEHDVEPDAPIDLIDFFQEKLQQQEAQLRKLEGKQPGGGSLSREDALRTTLRQLDWIQKFTLVNSAADYEPLDALA